MSNTRPDLPYSTGPSWVVRSGFVGPLPQAEANKLQDALAAVFPDAGGLMNEFCGEQYQCQHCDGWGEKQTKGLGYTPCRFCRGTGWRGGVYPA